MTNIKLSKKFGNLKLTCGACEAEFILSPSQYKRENGGVYVENPDYNKSNSIFSLFSTQDRFIYKNGWRIYFSCPVCNEDQCEEFLESDIPATSESPSLSSNGFLYCSHCGSPNDKSLKKCEDCGANL